MKQRQLGMTVLFIALTAAAAPVAAQSIAIGPDNDGDSSVWFWDEGDYRERLYWDNSDVRFRLTDTLEVNRLDTSYVFFPTGHLASFSSPFLSAVVVNGADLAVESPRIHLNAFGPDGSAFLCFWEGTSCGRSLRWDDPNSRFAFDDSLLLTGPIQSGLAIDATSQSYNLMGGDTPASGDITNDGDLFVANDVEIGHDLYLNQNLYMERAAAAGADADQTIWFYDDDDREANFIRWDDVRADAACSGTSVTNSGFRWNIKDDINSAWLLTNGTDIEFKVDATGDVAMDGSLTQSGSCDLAETFVGPELEPGTVVVLELSAPEAVVESTAAYQETVVGVVSTEPGVLLNGPTADFAPHREEFAAVREALAAHPGDPALEVRVSQLEALRDGWRRGNLPIALAGRVPVKVDGAYGVIRAGDALTSSPTPGHAMAMDRPGPTLGVALEDFTGETGRVLMLVKPGWYVPGDWAAAVGRGGRGDGAALAAANERIAQLEARLTGLEELLEGETRTALAAR